jgi:glucosamine--fructose-6-phosphate aminotransferase (isomerizing)
VNRRGERMAADMAAQPQVLQALADRRSEVLASLGDLSPAGVVVIARGSSDYAAVFGRYLFEAAGGRPAALAAPSLITLYGVEPRVEGWLAVAVSQSGRTPEIATVLDAYARAGARTLAVTNDPDSPLATTADHYVALAAGEERAVPATKTFTAQLAAMALIAQALGPVSWGEGDWERMPAAVEEVLGDSEPAERAAASLGGAHELVAVGRGYVMCVALETALKLREAAGVRAEGWSAADFRHGPMTVAGSDLPLVAVSASGPAAADTEEVAAALEAEGTPVLRLADRPDASLPYPPGLAEPLATIPAVVRGQQLALALALRRGVDPDEPPGLRKVTPTT